MISIVCSGQTDMPYIRGTLTNMSVERQKDGVNRILQRPLLPRLFSESVCVEFESIFKDNFAAFWCVSALNIDMQVERDSVSMGGQPVGHGTSQDAVGKTGLYVERKKKKI